MKNLRRFRHINANTVEDAVSHLHHYGDRAWVVAGGTDLIGTLRFEVLPKYPEAIINLKTIPGMDYIKEEAGLLKIGALTRLEDIAVNSTVGSKYAALSEAARRTASPHVRAMGTIGGNICQLIRCWYFRKEDNRFDCIRKGGKACHAITGDNRYHSIFGAVWVASPPCASGCPAGVDIPAYLSKIRDDDLTGASQILLNSNPLPAITGRVCPHFCEEECNRGHFDEAISIKSIERYIGDHILQNPAAIFSPPPRETSKRVAVVGSGPAGLSAAYYLRKAGYSPTVFEAMDEPGGTLTYGIPPYRLLKEVIKKQIKAFESIGIQFKCSVKVGKDITLADLRNDFDAVFIACGAWKERSAGIKGENWTLSGAEFLRKSNLGNAAIPGKNVAIIGGGNVAIDVARSLLRLGAEPLVIYRRTRDEMPALKEEVERAEQERIKIQFLTLPIEVSQRNGKLVLSCIRMRLGPIDKTGRPSPVPIEGSEFSLELDGVIKAIGEEPDISILPEEFLDSNGHIKIDTTTSSLGQNVFAGGDFVTGPSTVIAAISGGREAAKSIDQYLQANQAPGEAKTDSGARATKFNSDYLKKTRRVNSPELPVEERVRSLNIEETGTLDMSGATLEANRCFNCGCEGVNPSDMAAALVALNARIVTSRRTINVDNFWAVDKGIKSTILENDEIVTEIQIPTPLPAVKSTFIKFALRKSIDFPIINCSAAIESEKGIVKSARICLNAVYSNPYRATKAEDAILGKPIDEASADAAGDAAVSDAIALPCNRYKIQIAKTMVKRAILACE
jgi:NADPH-dependent glutamate synthase beta subunit-like oxidoreductase/CO/xanthine dehydrogenase FAD-binding subunit